MEATGSSTHILETKQSPGKGTVLYKMSFKFPGKTLSGQLKLHAQSYPSPANRSRSLFSGAREKFCPI